MKKEDIKTISKVELKNGKKMYHFKDNNSRHVFFSNLVAMNYWMTAILIFILLTSILIGFYQLNMQTEIGNRLLVKLNNIEGALGIGNATLVFNEPVETPWDIE
jgi:hypothetical protein